MKYILAILLVFPMVAFAARFDFSGGVPVVMDDGDAGDTYEQTRYDFSGGVPSPVFDTTATIAGETEKNLVINNGTVKINNGTIIIK